MVRNPFHALVAEFNRQMTSKTGFVEPQLFSSMGWDDFINEYRNGRLNILQKCFKQIKPKITRVFAINMIVIYLHMS